MRESEYSAHDGTNLIAYVGVAVCWEDPGTQGKQHRGNINSSIADLAIEKDKHEFNLGRCPGPTRTLMAFNPHTRAGSDTVARERYSVIPFFGFGPRTIQW